MKKNNVAVTHTVGIGDGVSFDMIRRGANICGGEHLFIMNNEEMQKQIIYLLESITKCAVSNFNLEYNQKLIECTEPLIPEVMKKGRPIDFFLKFKEALPSEMLEKENLKISYFDEEL